MLLPEVRVVYDSDSMDSDYVSMVELLEQTSPDSDTVEESRKRKRSAPQSWEEKIQMKKLRNRIAAQTSRDKKKARMDYLEDSVRELRYQNKLFQRQMQELRRKNEELAAQNAELTSSMAKVTCSCRSTDSKRRTPEGEENAVPDQPHPRPAESCDPQQKGSSWPAAGVFSTSPQFLLRLMMVYSLLKKTSSPAGVTQNDLPTYCSTILCSLQTDPTKKMLLDKLMPFAEKNRIFLLDWWKTQKKVWEPPPNPPFLPY